MKRLAPILLSLCAAIAARAEEPFRVDSLVASVNGEPVTLSDVQSSLRPFLAEARRAMPAEAVRDPRAVYRVAFTNALAELENRRLVVQKYREGDLRMPDYAVDREAAANVERLYGGDMHALQLELGREGRTYSEWKADLEESLIVRMMRQTFVNGSVHVSPAEVVRAWETRRSDYVPAARIHVAIAVFPAGDSEATAAFLGRVAQGEKFEALVAEPSDEERILGAGDYGWIDPAAELAPAFASTVLALRDGKASPPVVVGDHQYVICRVASEKVAEPTLAEVWDRIEEDLWTKASDALYRDWVAGLRQGAAIREFLPEGL